MIKKSLFLLAISFVNLILYAQDTYEQVYTDIENMLSNKIELNFKDAVILTEYAYYNGKLETGIIDEQYETLCRLVNGISNTELITYIGEDKDIITKHAAIFKVLTSPILIPIDSMLIYEHKPLTYDFEDPLGQSDWEKMFVTKLLKTRKGNCHSLPYLYKILADQFNIP